MKKIMIYLIACIIFLLACWRIGKILNPQQDNMENIPNLTEVVSEVENASENDNSLEDEKISDNDNKLDNEDNSRWEEYVLTFENATDTSDNPWGFTAGMIDTDTDGKCVFLTPNTSVNISGVREKIMGEGLSFEMSIYPQVAEMSDGAGVIVWYLDENNEILQQESFEICSKELCQNVLLMCEDEQVTSVKLLCNNGTNDDDTADWLIISIE